MKWSQSPLPPQDTVRWLDCDGFQAGAPTRNCTELPPIPMERIAKNALRALKLASLTGFAPVISCMRGRRVGWTKQKSTDPKTS